MICARAITVTRNLTDGRAYDQCETCTQVGPLDDQGAWREAHHAEANAAQARIEAAVRGA